MEENNEEEVQALTPEEKRNLYLKNYMKTRYHDDEEFKGRVKRNVMKWRENNKEHYDKKNLEWQRRNREHLNNYMREWKEKKRIELEEKEINKEKV